MAIFYVPGSYLNSYMTEDKFILLNIEDKFVAIMFKVNHEHKKNMRVENGVKVLYLKLLKDIYGCMDYELLCYDIY